jgi:chemotaxis protein methyltransferase WspC
LRSAPAREAVARDPATLDDIVRIADQGRIQEATLACDDYLRQRGASARAYCLRGLLTEAAGQLDASLEYYRKALYLDPNHEETLLHLSLLLEKRGDAAAAERLRARALRAARGAGGR